MRPHRYPVARQCLKLTPATHSDDSKEQTSSKENAANSSAHSLRRTSKRPRRGNRLASGNESWLELFAKRWRAMNASCVSHRRLFRAFTSAGCRTVPLERIAVFGVPGHPSSAVMPSTSEELEWGATLAGADRRPPATPRRGTKRLGSLRTHAMRRAGA